MSENIYSQRKKGNDTKEDFHPAAYFIGVKDSSEKYTQKHEIENDHDVADLIASFLQTLGTNRPDVLDSSRLTQFPQIGCF